MLNVYARKVREETVRNRESRRETQITLKLQQDRKGMEKREYAECVTCNTAPDVYKQRKGEKFWRGIKKVSKPPDGTLTLAGTQQQTNRTFPGNPSRLHPQSQQFLALPAKHERLLFINSSEEPPTATRLPLRSLGSRTLESLPRSCQVDRISDRISTCTNNGGSVTY